MGIYLEVEFLGHMTFPVILFEDLLTYFPPNYTILRSCQLHRRDLV